MDNTQSRLRAAPFWTLVAFVIALPFERALAVGGVSPGRLAGVVALGAGVLAVATGARIPRPEPLQYAVLGLVVWSGLSVLWTVDRSGTVERAATMAQILALALLVHVFVRTEHQRQVLFAALLVAIAFISCSALWEIAFGEPARRYSGGDLNPNLFGRFVSLGIVIAWWISQVDVHRWRRRAAYGYVVVAPYLVVMTFSRGAYVTLVVASVWILVCIARRWGLRWTAVLIGTALVGASALALVLPERSVNRIVESVRSPTETSSFVARGEAMATGLEIIGDRPVTGAGAGAYGVAARPISGSGRGAHNTLVQVAGELGLVGLALFLGILVICLRRALERRRGGIPLDVWLLAVWFTGAMFEHGWHQKWTWVVLLLVGARVALPAAAEPEPAREVGTS